MLKEELLGESPPAPSPDDDARNSSKLQAVSNQKKRPSATLELQHTDVIQDAFWDIRPWLLSEK